MDAAGICGEDADRNAIVIPAKAGIHFDLDFFDQSENGFRPSPE
jgi:hypothetical protein